MIRVMIVDDMPIFLEYMRTTIDWNTYGFELCCEASNGEEALHKAEQFEPDIVLSDITMPKMDGLAFTEKLMERQPSISVVLITGNSEFEYARKAIRLGVVDYIVKPFEKEELIITLLKLQDNINRAVELKPVNKDERTLRKTAALRQLIYANNIQKRSDIECILNLEPQSDYYIITLEVDSSTVDDVQSENAMNWKKVIAPLYDNYMEQNNRRYFFSDFEGRVVFINRLDHATKQCDEEEELRHFVNVVKEKLMLSITMGVGSVYKGFEGIRKSYLESVNALTHRYQRGGNDVIFYETISLEEKTYGFYSAEINEIILNHLHQRNSDLTLEVIGCVFAEADVKNYSSGYRRMVNMGLISMLLSYLVKIGRPLKEVFPNGFDPYTVINSQTDGEQRKFIRNTYMKAFDYLKKNSDTRAGKIAKDAVHYIESHYADSQFSMNDLCRALLVNQTYLRKMFKSEMNTTIGEYLTKVRMEKSKILIGEAKHKLSVIAEQVGYSDAGYFSRCFKNYYGISPSEYQQSIDNH